MEKLEAFEIITAPQDYVPFEKGERHGSYEWTWSRKSYGGVTRFVVVALTPPLGRQPGQCRLEVWMGGHSNDGRFGRYLVAQWDSVDPEKLDGEPLKKRLSNSVAEAAECANKLDSGDLPTLMVTTATARNAGEETKISGVGGPPQD